MPGRFRQQFGFGAVQHKRASAEMKHTVHCWCGPPNEVLTSVFVDLGELCRSVIFVTDSSRVTGIQFIYRVSEAVSLFEERAMQFHLETDELKLLANVLLEQDPRQYNELLNKVMARDLRFDSGELEQTAELLAGKKRSLKNEIARQSDGTPKAELQRQLTLLERVLEKVNEACVMF
jgi:hypothetical protein